MISLVENLKIKTKEKWNLVNKCKFINVFRENIV